MNIAAMLMTKVTPLSQYQPTRTNFPKEIKPGISQAEEIAKRERNTAHLKALQLEMTRAALRKVYNAIGDGWFKSIEIANRLDKSQEHVCCQMNRWNKKGYIQKRKINTRDFEYCVSDAGIELVKGKGLK